MPLPTPQKSTASYFYKYSRVHLHRLKNILFKHEIYLPNLMELNDDNDGLPHLAMQSEQDMASLIYRKFAERNPNMTRAELLQNQLIIGFNVRKHGPAALHPHLVKSLDAQFNDFRIYSMTKRYDMPNLWALYADGHRGYCLEFENVGPLFQHAKDVSYLDAAQMEITLTEPSFTSGHFLFCKTKNWSNEEEVRLVLPRHDGRSRIPFSPQWLTRIILGKAMPDEHATQITKWAKQREPELKVVHAFYDAVIRSILLK